jgi:hypothetical protein
MKSIFLNIATLADQPLRFAYGLSASHGKGGNQLLAKLGEIFEQEFLIRKGKLAIMDKKRERVSVDFGSFEAKELDEACVMFIALSETFKKDGGHKSSAKIFRKIAVLCYGATNTQTGLGLA